MKAGVAIVGLALVSATLCAQQAAQNSPDAIEGWILQHLGDAPTIHSFDQLGPSTSTIVTSVAFQGCTVSLTTREATQGTWDAPMGSTLPDGTFVDTHVNRTVHSTNQLTADLSNAQPGKITTSQPKTTQTWQSTQVFLNIPLVKPVSMWYQMEVVTNGGQVKSLDPSTNQASTIQITLSDNALAQRQANAWRDLITACGGKDISDNMY